MIPGVLGSACQMAKKHGHRLAHLADLGSPQPSIWGKDLDNLPDSTSPGRTRLHQPRERHSSPIDRLP
jgi:hypothetical protein